MLLPQGDEFDSPVALPVNTILDPLVLTKSKGWHRTRWLGFRNSAGLEISKAWQGSLITDTLHAGI